MARSSSHDIQSNHAPHIPYAHPVAVANWARVEDGKVRRVRVTFDPRPLLG